MEVKFQLVMDANGLVDRDASIDAMEDMITNLCVSQEQEQKKITEAVSAVFDTLKGKRAPLGFVLTQVVNKIGVQAENYPILEKRVNDYLHINAKGDSALFNIGTGRGKGGIGRIVDMAI